MLIEIIPRYEREFPGGGGSGIPPVELMTNDTARAIAIPAIQPNTPSSTLSAPIILKICEEVVPNDLMVPISRIRSKIAMSMVFAIEKTTIASITRRAIFMADV